MALSRAWYTRANIPHPDVSTGLLQMKSQAWLLKANLMQQVATGTLGPLGAAPASAAWTCIGSSDGVTAGQDAVDRWGAVFDGTKIIRAAAGVAHSWFILRSPAAIGSFYMLIDLGTAADTSILISFSKNAYVGGTITARPTSTVEFVGPNSTQWGAGNAANHNMQFVTDANGNCYVHNGQVGTGYVNMALWFGALAEARAGESHNFFCAFHYLASGRGAPGGSSQIVTGRTTSNSAAITGGMLRWTLAGNTAQGVLEANCQDSAFDTLPCIVGNTNAGLAGFRGRFPDAVSGGAMNVGGSDPTTGAQERVCFGDFVTPHSVVPAL